MVASESYVRFVLALAPLVVVLAWSLERDSTVRKTVGAAFCGALFSLSVIAKGVAVWAVLPWLGLTSWQGVRALYEFGRGADRSTSGFVKLSSSLYLPVGGIWTLFDQLGFQPLGFSGIIVLLTGVHFHYAGFALPRLTSLWMADAMPTRAYIWAGWGIVLGVPLVAIGITASQLNLPPWIEIVSVSVLASSAFLISFGQMRWALGNRDLRPFSRWLFVLGSMALSLGMVLATLYGWRTVFPLSWVSIPFMYWVHGSLNSLGFCLPSFLAWRLK